MGATEKIPIGERILGPAGVVAQNLPGYEARQPQMEMANLCEQVLQNQGQALIEAGTGTGKSLAYLIPALESGQKVVVSTESIQLQEQLIRKDLPFLEKALGRPLNFAIAKGRGNYFCERNTLALIQEETSRLQGTGGDPTGLHYARELLAAFADEWDGNKATLTISVPDLLWNDFAGDDACTGARCPYAGDCAYMAAKEKLAEADLIIANHHFALLHHYVKERSGGVINLLPEHRVWIADEAHTLSDVAQNVYGIELRQGQPKRFVTKLLRQLKALKLEIDAKWDVPAIEAAAEDFFDCFRGALKDEQILEEFGAEILAEAGRRAEALCATLRPIITGLHRLAASIDGDDPETRRALRMLRMQADGLIDALQVFFRDLVIHCPDCGGTGTDEATDDVCEGCDGTGSVPDLDPPVLYAEVTTRSRDRSGKKHVALHAKPIETARIFRRIYQELDTAIFCSATLAVGGSFSVIAEELGLNPFEVETLQAKSPFDYASQVRGYFPKSVPDRKSPDYHDALAEEVLRIVEWTEGRAFILFTANRDMRAVYERIDGRCPYPVLMQGEMPKDLLIERFREEPSVLLGVRTFWTGVDIPGQALSCVVLVAFPFPQPEAPLVKARCQRIEARGRRSFDVYSLPRVVRDIQQGFGRLIRSRTDRGLFAILDSRWHTARYARTIERSLPTFPKSEELPTDWRLGDAVYPADPETAAREFFDDPFADDGEHDAGDLAPGVAGHDREPASDLLPGVRAVGEPDELSTGVHFRSADRPGGSAGPGDCEPETLSLQIPGGGDGGGVAGTPREVDAAPGTDGCDPVRPGAESPHELDASPRARYLVAWVDAIYLDRGVGVGPVCELLTVGERTETRAQWETLWKQYQRVDERNAWLAANPYASEELHAKAARSEARLAELIQGLMEWVGDRTGLVWDLIGEVALRRREAQAEPQEMRRAA